MGTHPSFLFKSENPTYESICYENTDHAEVLLVEFDEDLISYELLVDEFWKCHDPTTLDRQGPDVGRQYRSVIYYYDDIQKIHYNKVLITPIYLNYKYNILKHIFLN